MFDPKFLLLAFGVIFTALGLAAHLGMWKKWYWRSRGAVYGYVPLGLMFLLYSFNEQLTTLFGPLKWIYWGMYGLLIGLGVWWSLRPPRFVKPAWVHWIEAYPQQVFGMMEKAAQDDPQWDSYMGSPESIEAWLKTLKAEKRKIKPASKPKR
jgi:hypothetical protein